MQADEGKGETMISLLRFYIYAFVSATLLVFIAIEPAAAGTIGKQANAAGWQTYSNTESNFTFRYPEDWEIADDGFYVTAGGAVANQWSVTLQTIGGDEDSNNWIRINPRQFDESDGICSKAGTETICTYSTDPNVLDIFKKIIASFAQKSGKTEP